MTAISEQKMDKGSSTCSSYDHIIAECRSDRNIISALRKFDLETISSATAKSGKKMYQGSSTCSPFVSSYDMTDECRSARNKISAAIELYLERIQSETKGNIHDLAAIELYLERIRSETKGHINDLDVVFNAKTKHYKYPFENLVLQGGGAKGIAYCGLIKVLEEHGILQQMKRFAGTSAGAITAALLAVGYNSYDAEKILCVDFEKLVYDSSWLKYPLNLYRGYGVNTGKRFDRFIGDLLALKTGNPDVTFEEVYGRFNKELCLVVVNVDTSKEMYCHVKTTPQMPVRLAVRMSMSIPGLFQAVKYKQSYFVDGGLLCNYPIHCFDGWFLSMRMEDAFCNKIQSLNHLQEITSLKYGFYPANKTTIGGMVYCDGENISYREMLEQSTGVPLGNLPDTALTRKYAKGIAYDRKVKELYEETVKAVVEFDKVLTDHNEHYSGINKEEFMAAFNEPSFTAIYKTRLFGEGYDPETAWTAVNTYGRDEVQFTDITSFIESNRLSRLVAFKDHERKDTSNLLAFSSAMILGLSESAMQNVFQSTDIDRSVGIDTWYVQTTNFKLEDGDKQFLTKQGRDSTMQFLQNFLENNDLENLNEMDGIVIPASVDKRKLEKIIEGECTMSSTLTTIVIASTTLLLLCGLLYVPCRQIISRTTFVLFKGLKM